MKTEVIRYSKIIPALAIMALLASCSSSEELSRLSEYDDIYYSGSTALSASANEQNPTQPSWDEPLGNASAAEQSYYGNENYVEDIDEQPEETQEFTDDYYEDDYGRRINNFHRSNSNAYIYDDRGFGGINNGPNWNVGLGYSSFGGSPYWNTGFNYGFPRNNGFGNFGGFYGDPFGPRFSYGYPMYSPFSPFNNSYFGNPYAFNPYGYSPFGFNPYMNGGFSYNPFCPTPGFGFGNNPYYSGFGNGIINDGGNAGFSNTQRATSTNSARPSRGGVISQQGVDPDTGKRDIRKSADGNQTAAGSTSAGSNRSPRSESNAINTQTNNRDGQYRNVQRDYVRAESPTRERTNTLNGANASESRSVNRADSRSTYQRPNRSVNTRDSGINSVSGANDNNSRNSVSPYSRERQNATINRTRSNTNYASPSSNGVRRSGSNSNTYQRSRSSSSPSTPTYSSPSSSPSRSSGSGSSGSSSPTRSTRSR